MEVTECIKQDMWISETALWVKSWEHAGSLIATCHSQLLRILKEPFGKASSDNSGLFAELQLYCTSFVESCNSTPEEDLHDVVSLFWSEQCTMIEAGLLSSPEIEA